MTQADDNMASLASLGLPDSALTRLRLLGITTIQQLQSLGEFRRRGLALILGVGHDELLSAIRRAASPPSPTAGATVAVRSAPSLQAPASDTADTIAGGAAPVPPLRADADSGPAADSGPVAESDSAAESGTAAESAGAPAPEPAASATALEQEPPPPPAATPLSCLELTPQAAATLGRFGVNTGEQLANTPESIAFEADDPTEAAFREAGVKLERYRQRSAPGHVSDTKPPAVEDADIGQLHLSPRAENALRRARITHVSQIESRSDEELLACWFLGRKTLAEIRDAVAAYRSRPPQPVAPESPPSAAQEPIASASPLERETSASPEDELLARIPLHRIGLPSRLIATLAQSRIRTIGQVSSAAAAALADSPDVAARVHACVQVYKEWFLGLDEQARAQESSGEGLNPWQRAALQRETLADIAAAWLSCLDERLARVIRLRFGLDGAPLTLERIGQELQLTRERARQLEQKGLTQLANSANLAPAKPLVALLREGFRRHGGLLSEAQLAQTLEEAVPPGAIVASGLAELCVTVTRMARWFASLQVWGWHKMPLHLLEPLAAELRELLRSTADIKQDELLKQLRQTAFAQAHPEISDDMVFACLRCCSGIRQATTIYPIEGLGQNTRLLLEALRRIGHPAHYSEIAAVVNVSLPPGRQLRAQDVQTLLRRERDVFVNVGLRGTYGLKEWGLEQAPTYEQAIASILEQAGQPLTSREIVARLPSVRPYFDKNAVAVALSANPRFRALPGRLYALAEWDTPQPEAHARPNPRRLSLVAEALRRLDGPATAAEIAAALNRSAAAGAAFTQAEVEDILRSDPDRFRPLDGQDRWAILDASQAMPCVAAIAQVLEYAGCPLTALQIYEQIPVFRPDLGRAEVEHALQTSGRFRRLEGDRYVLAD